MITQVIKEWLRKAFAWWPWKQTASIEYQHVASSVAWGSTAEAHSWSTREGTVPQPGTTPRLSTLEGRLPQPRPEEFPPSAPPTSLAGADMERTKDPEGVLSPTPTPQQRLEFLRYLVQRGIVNEGFQRDKTDL
ncbi:MAG TPA: hypothetical protein VFV38_39090 [Ktedonobacteraceae bacterium]|nr:hypothetical protein [Ktedonobacteraceae bacterium]